MGGPHGGSGGDELAALGLTEEHLRDALVAAEDARRTATPNDAPNAAGTLDYFARVRALRDILITTRDWRRLNYKQLPLVVNPDHTVAIGVLLGDERTGQQGAPPRGRRPVGTAKAELIGAWGAEKPAQLALAWEDIEEPGEEAVLDDTEQSELRTWYLLSRRVPLRGQVVVYSELSLPESVNAQGHVDRWTKRILLRKQVFEDIRVGEAGSKPQEGVDVPVEER